MKNNKSVNVKGFTMMELIVVIAIIVVMLSMFGFGVSGMMKNDKFDEANADAKILHSAIQDWLIDLEVSGVDAFVDNTAYDPTNTRYATITSLTYPGTYDSSKEIMVNSVMTPWESVNGDGFQWVIKDWKESANAQYDVDNGTGYIGSIGGISGYIGSIVNPEIEHDISQYIANTDLATKNGTWLAVIDTEQMAVLWTTWIDQPNKVFDTNTQRFYATSYRTEKENAGHNFHEPPSMPKLNWLSQEYVYNHPSGGIAIGCYPMADEMAQKFVY